MKNTILTMALVMAAVGCYHTNNQTGDPPECVTASDCEDGVECTIDFCDNGTCQVIDMCEDPVDCESAADCEDGIECTLDYCDAGTCVQVDMCEEAPDCDSTLHSFNLATEAHRFDVATNDEVVAFLWQEGAYAPSESYVATFDPSDPPEELSGVSLEPEEDVGARSSHILWYSDLPQVFWASITESAGDFFGSLMMADFDPASGELSETSLFYDDYDARLGQIAYHPSGELGITWSGWEEATSYAHAFFGRFTPTGETIEIMGLSETDYSFAPLIEPTSNGYNFAFTGYYEVGGRQHAAVRKFSFTEGLSEELMFDHEGASYIAGGLAATEDKDIFLWYTEITAAIRTLNVSWLDHGEETANIMLDFVAREVDALSMSETDEVYVSWCSQVVPGTPSALKAVHISAWSVTLVLYQEMPDSACQSSQLLEFNGHPMVFWLDNNAIVSYQNICSL